MTESTDQRNHSYTQHNESLRSRPMNDIIENLISACEWYGNLELDPEIREFYHHSSQSETSEEFKQEYNETYNSFLQALDKLKEIHNATN